MNDLASRSRSTAPALADRYYAEGWWTDDTLATFLTQTISDNPDLAVRIWSDTSPFDGTVGELLEQARRFAGALHGRGLRPGEVLAYQLPNSAEAVITLWGGALAGLVLVPIVPFYGPNEVCFILEQSQAKELVNVDSWDDADLLGPPLDDVSEIDPAHPAIIAFTSGTTADPKGVMHSHRSLLAELRQQSGASFRRDQPMLSSAPLAHMSGLLGGLMMPLNRGEPIHLIDKWDPGRVLDIMEQAGVRPGGGPPIYITSLLDHPRFSDIHRSLIPAFGMGGAPIPAAVAERAEGLGIKPWPVYGSTEHPTITQASAVEEAYVRINTVGSTRPGVEIRIAADTGEVLSRGPDLFCGYTDPHLTAAVFDEDGWYHTGDVGTLNGNGHLSITDRIGDLIIRGGRNISGCEIEGYLLRHPAVAEVAVVAAPHPSLGETACAVIRPHADMAAPAIDELLRSLAEQRVPKQKWPESVHVVEDFPRTPTGKIRKQLVRAEVAALTNTAPPNAAPINETDPTDTPRS
jgi:acyl-CoA synthetase